MEIWRISRSKQWGGLAAVWALLLPFSAQACTGEVQWYADLRGANVTPVVSSRALGRAVFVFDFERPRATVKVCTLGLQDVSKIELRVARTQSDYNGPVVALIYDARYSPFSMNLSKSIGDADIVKTKQPAVASIQDVANLVLKNQIAVVVYTTEHPDGEIAGTILMHYDRPPVVTYTSGAQHYGAPLPYPAQSYTPPPPYPAQPTPTAPAGP